MAEKKQKTRQIKINPRIYPLRVIYSSSYLFLDKAYIFLEGDPKKEILVRIRAKDNEDAEKLARELQNELLNASLRQQISKENKKIREFIVGSALLSVSEKRYPDRECGCRNGEYSINSHKALNRISFKTDKEKTFAVKEEKIADPLGIGIPWEEKHEATEEEKAADLLGIGVPWEEKYEKGDNGKF